MIEERELIRAAGLPVLLRSLVQRDLRGLISMHSKLINVTYRLLLSLPPLIVFNSSLILIL